MNNQMIQLEDVLDRKQPEYWRVRSQLVKTAQHKPVRDGAIIYWHRDDIETVKQQGQTDKQDVVEWLSISAFWGYRTKQYKTALRWLHNNAKHKPRKADNTAKTLWHFSDIEAFQHHEASKETRVDWDILLSKILAEPKTMDELMRTLDEDGMFFERPYLHNVLARYRQNGLVKRSGAKLNHYTNRFEILYQYKGGEHGNS